MRKERALALAVLAFLIGFWAERRWPRHHYVHYAGTTLLLDTATGRVCDRRPQSHNRPAFPPCGEN